VLSGERVLPHPSGDKSSEVVVPRGAASAERSSAGPYPLSLTAPVLSGVTSHLERGHLPGLAGPGLASRTTWFHASCASAARHRLRAVGTVDHSVFAEFLLAGAADCPLCGLVQLEGFGWGVAAGEVIDNAGPGDRR
jgi:hypothetical protein